MSVFLRGDVWWYKFRFASRMIREPAKTGSKTVARNAEHQRRRELEEGYNNIGDRRDERIQPVSAKVKTYLEEYPLKHRSSSFADYALGHVERHLGKHLIVDVSPDTVRQYQSARLREKASPKSVNEEVGFLLRVLAERGDAIRAVLRRDRNLKLRVPPSPGKAFSKDQKTSLLEAAIPQPGDATKAKSRSPYIRPALQLAFNAGMRDAEIRNLTWAQIDLDKRFLIVGRSKTDAGEGRTIPLNNTLFRALIDHCRWYTDRFGSIKPEWYVFPGRVGRPEKGRERPLDPTKPVTSFKTAWASVRDRAGVAGRFHDTRHTLITELAESGAGDQTIMDIAGHVSRQMLARYSHIRIEAKRRALESVETPVEVSAEPIPAEAKIPDVGHKIGHNPPSAPKRPSASVDSIGSPVWTRFELLRANRHCDRTHEGVMLSD
jgi:integrase